MIKVLIVEDDPMVAEFNKRYLEQIEGFTLVAVARSADVAMVLLKKHEVDLVLLDIFMPGINGLELLAQIRKTGQGVDVMIVSAACDSATIKTALRNGAVDYLIKPFEFERLHAALAQYRNKVLFMRGRDALSQAELDRHVLSREEAEQKDLPKGLDRTTLKLVWETVLSGQGAPFTTEEIANRVGISRVSMRKYLGFLRYIDLISREVVYGAVGRPVYKYRCLRPESEVIKQYL
ncbi:Hypothetical protein LUCI_5115 [Lucifera butyrica]|uniref:Transcriptional regulatory protein n=1 Tax=Lucifera butyrica TaxID=1351585 RepID=A0A498RFT5_9FIRM|nr:response regulator [Lucifera butyrica]VBB09817.1 Hypothetical protein LUCI_5115 [Lucifera butyrica]